MTRAEFKRELLAFCHFTPEQLEKAVSVTERLLREQRERWGHVMCCQCSLCPELLDPTETPSRDPRCAPQEKPHE